MTLQASGRISLSDFQTEFGGANPISLSEYYNVSSSPVPTSGVIALSNFYGKAITSRSLADARTGTNVNTSNIPSTVRRVGVIVVGGGGSGAAGGTGPIGGAGGGSGGFAFYVLEIPDAYLGGYFTYTVGAGGAAVTNVYTDVGKAFIYDARNGNSGGTTTVIYKSAGGTTVATFTATGGGGGGFSNSGSNTLDNTPRGTAGSYSNSLVFGTLYASTVYSGGLGGGVYDWTGGAGGGSSYQQWLNNGALTLNGANSSNCNDVAGANGGGNGVGRNTCVGNTNGGNGNTADDYAGSGGGGTGDTNTGNRTSGAGAAGRIRILY